MELLECALIVHLVYPASQCTRANTRSRNISETCSGNEEIWQEDQMDDVQSLSSRMATWKGFERFDVGKLAGKEVSRVYRHG